ncbi:MAG: AAA family ATPase [Opitutaceae bacterium]
MKPAHPWAAKVAAEIEKAVLGQQFVVERLLVALLANGHVLLEGMPGLAKTLLVKSLGTALGLQFERVQFTPDLLPSDVVGTMVFQPKDGQFIPHLGPIFANLVLADEINRAPAKVQSALLEGMQERQVTIGGTSHRLPHPFFVMATQNPVEQEGTYPLPEAQRDRFMFKLLVDYPEERDELEMMRRWGRVTTQPELTPVSSAAELLEIRTEVDATHASESIQGYILSLVRATREIAAGAAATTSAGETTEQAMATPSAPAYLSYGASPRASIALYQAGKALAWLRGLDHVTPGMVQEVFADVMRHRIGLTYEAEAESITADKLLSQILDRVPVPPTARTAAHAAV